MDSVAALLIIVSIFEHFLSATDLCWARQNIAMCPPRQSEADD